MFQLLRQRSARWLLMLALLELVLLALCVKLASHLRFLSDEPSLVGFSEYIWPRALLFAAVIAGGMAALGLYQSHLRETWFGLLARQAVGFLLGGIALIVVYYVFPLAYIGRGVFGLALLFGFVAIAAFRVVFARLVDTEALKRRVLVLGSGRRAALIPQRMRRRSDRRGFSIVGFVRMGEEEVAVPTEHLLEREAPLRAWAERLQIDEIVVGPDDRRGGLPMEELLDCKQAGIVITDLPTFFERESGKIKLSLIEPSWLVFSDGFDTSPLRLAIKRVFDVSIALVVLALTWPLMLLTALAIRLESGKGQPILYRQERVGEHGEVFALTKFRSMRTDAERDGVARWATRNDDRVTRVGRIIRKTRLDELPQLINVLRGQMSLVGPRPERPQFVAELAEKIRYYNLRHSVKPGLAGWAQLRYAYGASEEDAAEKLKYDLFYVKNHNLLFDVMILIQTVEIVLFGRGAR
ncbi:TIGR03013 family XrtA/PEP-CTERM system glycosyltransferase [Dokdonella sp.]|uniref:TIGR03013 family XrtA/PEP-CTERM system glycosyltransferase n=1 Tax=Dokdonella sp. TaxID=2291710 RepID=UPI001B2B2817|nr:TIGR03013 family XrtA/PEP-CTERM system glycosyltransferase [Dokdonella sp.]MBO9661968.1 TIGR03013 family PEP-CTERM/XrtA system glycosyltransferase [Dokdonella sp.]